MLGFTPGGTICIYNFETLTVSSTALPVTESKRVPGANLAACRYLFCTVETDAVRYRLDGTAPTATVGHLVQVGQNIEIHGEENVQNFRVIRVTTDATVQVSFGR